MKALTLWQPWASFVVAGLKVFETRPWATSHRGALVIHAAKREPGWVRGEFLRYRGQVMAHLLERLAEDMGADRRDLAGFFRALPRGAVLGCVDVVAVWPTDEDLPTIPWQDQRLGDFGAGRFAWELENPRRLEAPVPWRGHQRLWSIDAFEGNRALFHGRGS